MQPQARQRRTSISARDCPVCGTPVPWTRYWLRAGAWAKWPCPTCGSLLGFDQKRGVLMIIPAGLTVGLYVFMVIWMQYPVLIALPVLLVASQALGFLNRVTVV